MKKLNILVIDDEPLNIEIISNILNNEYNLKVATDGKRGLEAYDKFRPEIIISDLNMPNLDGIEMIKTIRQNDQNVKIIVLTCHDDVNYLLEATQLKLTKYLIKPIDKTTLFEAIHSAIEEISNYSIISNKIIQLPQEFIWDIENSELQRNSQCIKLTPKEKKVIQLLLLHPNNIKTYEEIFEVVWDGFYDEPNKKRLKTLMSTLRKKLPEGLIENVFAIGYKANI